MELVKIPKKRIFFGLLLAWPLSSLYSSLFIILIMLIVPWEADVHSVSEALNYFFAFFIFGLFFTGAIVLFVAAPFVCIMEAWEKRSLKSYMTGGLIVSLVAGLLLTTWDYTIAISAFISGLLTIFTCWHLFVKKYA